MPTAVGDQNLGVFSLLSFLTPLVPTKTGLVSSRFACTRLSEIVASPVIKRTDQKQDAPSNSSAPKWRQRRRTWAPLFGKAGALLKSFPRPRVNSFCEGDRAPDGQRSGGRHHDERKVCGGTGTCDEGAEGTGRNERICGGGWGWAGGEPLLSSREGGRGEGARGGVSVGGF